MVDQHIIAMGGGGFSMEETLQLDDYVLRVSQKRSPRICFVPTASGDSESYILRFYRCFSLAECRPADLSLFTRQVGDLEDFACSQDIIYVGGGNTANMLAIWRVHGFDTALKAALENGTLLAGISAGSICWFEKGITDSFGGDLQPLDCLGFLPGSNCPHYDGEEKRRPAYHRLIAGGFPGGYAADDGVVLHFVNGRLSAVVSSRENAKGYRVEKVNDQVIESPLEALYLGG